MGFRGANILKLREAKTPNWSQGALAEKVGVSQATISRIEKNEVQKRPDRGLAVRIAKALGVPLADVWVDVEGEMIVGAPPATPHATDRLGSYEEALYGAGAAPGRSRDVPPALAALHQVLAVAVDPVEPNLLAQELLDAVVALREAGQETSPFAIVSHVAMVALRAASPSADTKPDTKPTASKKTRAA